MSRHFISPSPNIGFPPSSPMPSPRQALDVRPQTHVCKSSPLSLPFRLSLTSPLGLSFSHLSTDVAPYTLGFHTTPSLAISSYLGLSLSLSPLCPFLCFLSLKSAIVTSHPCRIPKPYTASMWSSPDVVDRNSTALSP